MIDMLTFTFIKSLSTFVSLESALILSSKNGKMVNFSSKVDSFIKTSGKSGGAISNLD